MKHPIFPLCRAMQIEGIELISWYKRPSTVKFVLLKELKEKIKRYYFISN
jgi:hypothetical protein